MKPEYDLGDILIKRALNGWIAVVGNGHTVGDEDNVICYVYSDTNSDAAMSESLHNLLVDQFGCYLQTKRQPGIKISHVNISKEKEELDCLSSKNI